ncbi:MAG: long-chain-fatty-acid--CoA ligase [Cycloclasticus sp.]|nr:long-chain-fatty-acid--CoA ligase [Cycloclasticus sp.]MBG96405.1 long-chain-fatty-acid--CoA ligase [Cycloclasticus sp.]|tara:strand:- start:5427 stop:7088 length:1662 start_codon:yes stop_codon:yes gene_type:complete
MHRPWLSSYPKGISADIEIEKYASVVEIFEQSVKEFANRPAFSNLGTSLTYSQFNEATKAVAAYLQKTLNLKKGDRIAIMMPNLLQNPVSIFGSLRAGLTVVNTNPLYTARELRHQLIDSGATTIIVLENYAQTVQEIVADTDVKHIIITKMGDMLNFPKSLLINLAVKYIKKIVPAFSLPGAISFQTVVSEGSKQDLGPVHLTHNDLAFIQYTGGTTGLAKGAMLSHKNMVANMLQASEWIKNDIKPGQETIITALPLYHIFSLTANCMVFIEAGGHNVLITNPRDFKGFVKELSKTSFTVITGVNTLFNALINTKGFHDIDFSNLKITLGGGMSVQAAVAAQWQQITGCALVEAFGLTETSPAVCINPLNIKNYNGSIGLPIPSTYCKLIDSEGNDIINNEAGELCVKGPQVMQGYWKRPEETACALSKDGWLKTGDMAKMDGHGFFYIVDRLKEMILVSGFNVFPNEIENVIVDHPGVLECGVIGIPDEQRGEAIKAFVVKKDISLTEAELIAHCKKNLTPYKIPSSITFIQSLPKTNIGKVLRRALKHL